MKLLSYNIRFGGRGREERLTNAIQVAAPDLVVLQEATDPRIVKILAEAIGLPFWAARPGHSVAYLSRVEIAHHEWHKVAGIQHPFLEIVPAGSETRIFGLHLSARFSKWNEQRRVREIGFLLKKIEKHQEGFHVLVGDFNTLAPGEILNVRRMPAWIQVMIWLSGRDIQRETIQAMLTANYIDGYRTLQPVEKGYTFPTWDPHVRLDYIFLAALFGDRLTRCQVVNQPAEVALASDHFPLLADLKE